MTMRGIISFLLVTLFVSMSKQPVSAQNAELSGGSTKKESLVIHNAGRYTIDNGLTSNYVTCIERDKEGRIWLGTNDGMNSFDGYVFKSYVSDPNDTTALKGKRVSSMKQMDDHTLFLTLIDGGLAIYDKRVDKFRSVAIDDSYENASEFESAYGVCRLGDYAYVAYENNIIKINLLTDEISKIVMEARKKHNGVTLEKRVLMPLPGDRHIAVMLSRTTLGILDTKTDKIRITRLQGMFLSDICPKDANHVYMCTTNGLYVYDVDKEEYEQEKILQNTLVQSMTKDVNNGYWIAYANNNLMHWMPSRNMIKEVSNINYFLNKQSTVNAILEDENEILWLATSNLGLVKLDVKHPKILNIEIEDHDMPLNYVTQDIFASSPNEVWTACGFEGVVRVDTRKKKAERIPVANRNVLSVYVRKNGDVIFGTTRGPMKYVPDAPDGVVDMVVKDDVIESIGGRCIVNDICEDCLGNLWFATQVGLYKYNGLKTVRYSSASHGLENVNAVYEDADGRMWVGTISGSFVKEAGDSLFVETKAYEINVGDNNSTYCFADNSKSVFIGTAAGVLLYDKVTHEISPAKFNSSFGNTKIFSIECDDNDVIWISTTRGIGYIDTNYNQIYLFNHHDGLSFQGNECPKFTRYNNHIFVGNAVNLNMIVTNHLHFNNTPPRSFVSGVSYGQSGKDAMVTMESDTLFSMRYLLKASLKVRVASSDLTLPSRNEFMYKIDNEDWTHLSDGNEILISGPMPGKYCIEVRATNADKTWSDSTQKIYIIIVPPLWLSNAAIIFYIIVMLSLTWFLIDIRFRSMKKRMKQIENEARAKKTVEDQRNRLAKLHKDQEDSIRYAKRIQESLMPPVSSFERMFGKLFVYYMPRDIVSGDFYSFYHRDDKTFIIAADCTGHGVPGAFISILGVDHLYNIIMRQKIDDPGTILTYLHKDLHSTVFKRDNSAEEFNEGMDLTICVVHHKEKKIQFAGAMNDLYVIRDNDILTYHGDRHSIGTNSTIGEIDDKQYNSQQIDCQSGDMFYMFSDGFVDQFGGPEYKKFKHRRFKQLLLYIHKLPAKDQKSMLNRRFLEWRGANDQTDDVSVIGFEPWA